MVKVPVAYGFGHIYWRNPKWKTSFFCAVFSDKMVLIKCSKCNCENEQSTQQRFTCSKQTKNIKKGCEIESWQQIFHNDVHEVFLVSFLLTLNILHTFFHDFCCWLWTLKWLLADKWKRKLHNVYKIKQTKKQLTNN